MKLYHYTCGHTLKVVGRRGMLRPSPTFWGGTPLLWLTPQFEPDRVGLGLTSQILACDRLDYRYLVEDDAEPWLESAIRLAAPLAAIAALEHIEGARPDTWFVRSASTLGVLDRRYGRAA